MPLPPGYITRGGFVVIQSLNDLVMAGLAGRSLRQELQEKY